jgi:hypothetical protein
MRTIIIIILLFIISSGCTKDKEILPCPSPEERQPAIKFVFVNRVGFRNDSVGNSTNDTVLGGVCLESKYYNPQTNTSEISSTCYNRNFTSEISSTRYNRNFPSNNYPLSDSIVHRSGYPVYNGSAFAFEIELVWKDKNLFTTKLLKFATQNWPNGETINTPKDTIIKFVWPDDTLPGSSFHKTYQYP